MAADPTRFANLVRRSADPLRGPYRPPRETAKLDGVRAAAERTIALLQERRAAVIAAAATGQLNIASAAAARGGLHAH